MQYDIFSIYKNHIYSGGAEPEDKHASPMWNENFTFWIFYAIDACSILLPELAAGIGHFEVMALSNQLTRWLTESSAIASDYIRPRNDAGLYRWNLSPMRQSITCINSYALKTVFVIR